MANFRYTRRYFFKTFFQNFLQNIFFRMETWLANMLHIEEHNFEYALGRKTYSLGMNHYGDMTSDEFAKTYNGFLNSKKE